VFTSFFSRKPNKAQQDYRSTTPHEKQCISKAQREQTKVPILNSLKLKKDSTEKGKTGST
jgi:hypothetical protein